MLKYYECSVSDSSVFAFKNCIESLFHCLRLDMMLYISGASPLFNESSESLCPGPFLGGEGKTLSFQNKGSST